MFINGSLQPLIKVIKLLGQNVPRNSISFYVNPLIRITREYLTGKSKANDCSNQIRIFLAVSPSKDDLTETIRTITFGVDTGKILHQNFDTEARSLLKHKTKETEKEI